MVINTMNNRLIGEGKIGRKIVGEVDTDVSIFVADSEPFENCRIL